MTINFDKLFCGIEPCLNQLGVALLKGDSAFVAVSPNVRVTVLSSEDSGRSFVLEQVDNSAPPGQEIKRFILQKKLVTLRFDVRSSCLELGSDAQCTGDLIRLALESKTRPEGWSYVDSSGGVRQTLKTKGVRQSRYVFDVRYYTTLCVEDCAVGYISKLQLAKTIDDDPTVEFLIPNSALEIPWNGPDLDNPNPSTYAFSAVVDPSWSNIWIQVNDVQLGPLTPTAAGEITATPPARITRSGTYQVILFYTDGSGATKVSEVQSFIVA